MITISIKSKRSGHFQVVRFPDDDYERVVDVIIELAESTDIDWFEAATLAWQAGREVTDALVGER